MMARVQKHTKISSFTSFPKNSVNKKLKIFHQIVPCQQIPAKFLNSKNNLMKANKSLNKCDILFS